MEIKLDDFQIIDEEPLTIPRGRWRKPLIVGHLPLEPYYKFMSLFFDFLIKHASLLVGMDFLTYKEMKDKKKLDIWVARFTELISIKSIRNDILKIISKGYKVPKRWLRKHVNLVQLIEIFLTAYFFNVECVKKNIRSALEKLVARKAISSFSSSNTSDGQKKKSLQPRYRKLSYTKPDGTKPNKESSTPQKKARVSKTVLKA